MTKKTIQKFCGIEIFQWGDWKQLDFNKRKFIHVDFLIDSMKDFTNMIIEVQTDGYLTVRNSNSEVVWIGYYTDIPEVKSNII